MIRETRNAVDGGVGLWVSNSEEKLTRRVRTRGAKVRALGSGGGR